MRFRPWLVLSEASQQETQALKLLGGDEGLLAQLKSISPEPKFLPVLALLHREQPDLGQLGKDWRDYKRLLDSKKMPPLSVQGDKIVAPPQNQPINYLQWTEKVHAMSADAELVRRRADVDHAQWKPPIFKNDGLEIYETDGPGDCIRYGKGYSFCISQPGNTMWQSYRDSGSTFYFVYDKKRPDTDPLHIVVVDMTKEGPVLSDANNNTGTVAEYKNDARAYLDHLHKRGVPKDLLRNKDHTEEEREEAAKLGQTIPDLDWFKALSPDHKSKYIGRGHELSDAQFDYIFDNGMESLVKQYAEVGRKLNDHQMDRMLDSKFRSNYLHFRVIADQQYHDISPKEWERMTERQREGVSTLSRLRLAPDEAAAEKIIKERDVDLEGAAWVLFRKGMTGLAEKCLDDLEASGGEIKYARTLLWEMKAGKQWDAVLSLLRRTVGHLEESDYSGALEDAVADDENDVAKEILLAMPEKSNMNLLPSLKAAAFRGYLDLVQAILERLKKGFLKAREIGYQSNTSGVVLINALTEAARGKQPAVVKYLLDQVEEYSELERSDASNPIKGMIPKALEEAAGQGDLESVKLMVKWGALDHVARWDASKWRVRIMSAAASNDHLPVVEYLADNGFFTRNEGYMLDDVLASARGKSKKYLDALLDRLWAGHLDDEDQP